MRKRKSTEAACCLRWIFWTIVSLTSIFSAMPVHAESFRIANYNVENLFDLHRDGTEYEDYIPFGRSVWNQSALDAKLQNIGRVLKDLDADIVSLQEVESETALGLLRETLHRMDRTYAYAAIADERRSAVKCAVLSRYPIVRSEEIRVGKGQDRNILKVSFDIDGAPLILYVNHWKSKDGPESRRVRYAHALAEDIGKLKNGVDYIIVGDFNSNYNEYRTFRKNDRLNDTGGVTGINQVLGTIADDRIVDESMLIRRKTRPHLYNLWMELPESRRWSVLFHGRKETPDAILLPASLYDDAGVNYVDNSFDVFGPAYLFSRDRIYRWQREFKGRGRHLGKGYSDHLPVFAEFNTRPFEAATGR